MKTDREKEHKESVRTILNDLGLEVLDYASVEKKCGCDPIVNGKHGHVCQEHIYKDFIKHLRDKK